MKEDSSLQRGRGDLCPWVRTHKQDEPEKVTWGQIINGLECLAMNLIFWQAGSLPKVTFSVKKDTWMRVQSAFDVCHPVNCQSLFCWCGWPTRCSSARCAFLPYYSMYVHPGAVCLQLREWPSPTEEALLGQVYRSSFDPLPEIPNKLSGWTLPFPLILSLTESWDNRGKLTLWTTWGPWLWSSKLRVTPQIWIHS